MIVGILGECYIEFVFHQYKRFLAKSLFDSSIKTIQWSIIYLLINFAFIDSKITIVIIVYRRFFVYPVWSI